MSFYRSICHSAPNWQSYCLMFHVLRDYPCLPEVPGENKNRFTLHFNLFPVLGANSPESRVRRTQTEQISIFSLSFFLSLLSISHRQVCLEGDGKAIKGIKEVKGNCVKSHRQKYQNVCSSSF